MDGDAVWGGSAIFAPVGQSKMPAIFSLEKTHVIARHNSQYHKCSINWFTDEMLHPFSMVLSHKKECSYVEFVL